MISSGLYIEDKSLLEDFANWILDIDDGKECDENGERWIDIPLDLLLYAQGDFIKTIVDSIYPDILVGLSLDKYIHERAILTPTNEFVEVVNDYIISALPGPETTYLSSDTIAKADFQTHDQKFLYPTKFVNNLKFSGL